MREYLLTTVYLAWFIGASCPAAEGGEHAWGPWYHGGQSSGSQGDSASPPRAHGECKSCLGTASPGRLFLSVWLHAFIIHTIYLICTNLENGKFCDFPEPPNNLSLKNDSQHGLVRKALNKSPPKMHFYRHWIGWRHWSSLNSVSLSMGPLYQVYIYLMQWFYVMALTHSKPSMSWSSAGSADTPVQNISRGAWTTHPSLVTQMTQSLWKWICVVTRHLQLKTQRI